ncbi:hypothetical protein KKD52_05840 [Myxococcota bacterium]|jgi:hypothetical protein|nr:hypothetical protein [Myxococcota bacterium]MBU1413886.1 hypothetical protein [Myxococcota bacterium]MBU1509863.1 hypothetical protein [Myxococcota bacterium]PKN27043.1 MAG: hypothetical protein CVU65_03865 [Deltaproteobacteria bacterium HGW-Deltaproteobacteria-22]
MNEDKLDLHLLDPFPDPLEFERVTAALTAEILADRALTLSVWQSLYRRVRSAALCAAAAAGVVLVLHNFFPQEAAAPTRYGPEYTLLTWAATEHSPTTAELLDLIGGGP